MLFLLLACVPKLEDAPDKAAAAYCDHALDCGYIASDEVEDCVDFQEDLFQALWSPDRCEDNGFERESWGVCWDAINNWDCDDELLLGWLDIADDCAAAEVCEL